VAAHAEPAIIYHVKQTSSKQCRWRTS